MEILSPVPEGSGVVVLHQALAQRVPGYRLRPYSPWWTLVPPALSAFSSRRADLVHASADYGLFFKRKGQPLVATMHNYTSDRFMKPFSSPLQYLHYRTDLRFFTRQTMLLADRVVVISQFMRDRVSDDLKLNIPMHLIYNGVDEKWFVPAGAGSARQPGPFRILFCGNLTLRKRPQLLVPLANALGAEFEILYTGGLSGRSKRHGHPKPGAGVLKNLGKIDHADMPRVYRGVDALFMPSVREGFGLCVAEAMACGLPVVAADASALPELVHQEKGGYLCPIDDVAAYAVALKRLAESRGEATRMGEYNRSVVEERFSLTGMVDQYRRLFEETLM